jgi:hypothetical protein
LDSSKYEVALLLELLLKQILSTENGRNGPPECLWNARYLDKFSQGVKVRKVLSPADSEPAGGLADKIIDRVIKPSDRYIKADSTHSLAINNHVSNKIAEIIASQQQSSNGRFTDWCQSCRIPCPWIMGEQSTFLVCGGATPESASLVEYPFLFCE